METNMVTPEQRASEFLQPVIDDLGKRARGLGRGKGRAPAKKMLAERLSKSTGQHFRPERVNEWLHPDPAKRKEPKLGIGLRIMDVWLGMRGRKTKTTNETKGKRSDGDSNTQT